MRMSFGFSARLLATLLLALAAYGAFVALSFRDDAQQREATVLQGVSRDLARHIVEHWPEVSAATPAAAERQARQSVLAMLMAVNPGVQAYLLDADGTVAEYLGEPGMVRTPAVDLAPVRAFLAGAQLPLRGTDPMGSGVGRLFSAAMFPPAPGQTRPPGYLYIVLDGAARLQATRAVDAHTRWGPAGRVALAGLALAALIGAFSLWRVTLPLKHLAQRMRGYQAGAQAEPVPNGDELRVLQHSFEQMTRRIETQVQHERAQAAAHREPMAGIAHDLRTPLTALHGHLEALAQDDGGVEGQRRQLAATALQQSDKLRRLTQQLFELAALESAEPVQQRERFRLDELVADSVGKFRLHAATAAVSDVLLDGRSPGAIEVEGDLQLVERAVTNLIDNAQRHAAGAGPVRVSLVADAQLAQVVVEDAGPGLSDELLRRLTQDQSLREPPLRRAGGGIGGLGLAIAQRVALLHGGSLRPLPAPRGGTRLCLALPRAR
ncbi:MAG: sensor histidine kinase [Aquabacterium sp.]